MNVLTHDLVEATVPAFGDVGATVPASDDAPAGLPDPAGAVSQDEMTAAVISAMTLFGRVGIRKVVTWSTVADLSLDRAVA